MNPYMKETKKPTQRPIILLHQPSTLNLHDNIMDSARTAILKTKRNLNCVKSSLNKDTVHTNKNASSLMDYMNLRKTPNKTQNIKQNNVVFSLLRDAVSLVKDATLSTKATMKDRKNFKQSTWHFGK